MAGEHSSQFPAPYGLGGFYEAPNSTSLSSLNGVRANPIMTELLNAERANRAIRSVHGRPASGRYGPRGGGGRSVRDSRFNPIQN